MNQLYMSDLKSAQIRRCGGDASLQSLSEWIHTMLFLNDKLDNREVTPNRTQQQNIKHHQSCYPFLIVYRFHCKVCYVGKAQQKQNKHQFKKKRLIEDSAQARPHVEGVNYIFIFTELFCRFVTTVGDIKDSKTGNRSLITLINKHISAVYVTQSPDKLIVIMFLCQIKFEPVLLSATLVPPPDT